MARVPSGRRATTSVNVPPRSTQNDQRMGSVDSLVADALISGKDWLIIMADIKCSLGRVVPWTAPNLFHFEPTKKYRRGGSPFALACRVSLREMPSGFVYRPLLP